MQRPGPLQELPLERFLPSNPNIQPAAVKPIRSNKRPLSPGGPSLFSPAKRRILNDEGIYSPDKTCKSPLAPLVTSLRSPARFSRVLAGPASPARVLDFGLPKNVQGDPQKRAHANSSVVEITPVQTASSSSNRLAPSPELKARKARPTHASPTPDYPTRDGRGYKDEPDTLSLATTNVPHFVPRELPPRPDPHSIHYPGFDVFQDPHLTVFPITGEELSPSFNGELDVHKENLPPRRKPRKTASDLKVNKDVFSSATVTPRKSQSINQTPKRTEPWGSAELSSTIARNMLRISSPSTTSRHGMKSLLQMMKDEMDVADEDHNSSDE